MALSRRRFLSIAGVAGGLPVLSLADSRVKNLPDRSLQLHNLHTGEHLKRTYWSQGRYIQPSLSEFDQLLRDHRSNQSLPMDTRLFDTLFLLQQTLDDSSEIQIISGYRSPQTNSLLRKQGRKVAKTSYHMKGKALDIRLPKRSLKQVQQAALELGVGGVGYYPESEFVHIDTGRIRHWG